ncbi:MAG: hypothetical protein E7251_18535 [Paenibacillaceae bacterium]|nr:hypothetical protein [Paenibacillaceae bacterium]
MRGIIHLILMILIILMVTLFPVAAYAIGDGNIDNGGGSMGQGTSQNSWTPGMEGIRVTVVETESRKSVTAPIDLTNKRLSNISCSFGKVCKISYSEGAILALDKGAYQFVNPSQSLPKIISSQSLGAASIEAIKSYFTDEQVIRSIANQTGMDYDVLIGGRYKLLLEPIIYVKFQGLYMAMTATEAAMYDELTSGAVRAVLPTSVFQNLPLSMFLEAEDLGYPAWSGPKTGIRTNKEIKTALGLGIVRFKETDIPPEAEDYDYEYRINTEVITSVTVSGGQADPDNPVKVKFNIGSQTYTVSGVYYPEGDRQLVWVRWTTPSTPQTMIIRVSATGGGVVNKGTITAKIVDLLGNDPPNPMADDRNDSYTASSIPNNTQKTSASWGVWHPWWQENWVWHDGDDDDDGYWEDEGWWEFDWNSYSASLSASMSITPDEKDPTASVKDMKSGYGINQDTTAHVSTNQSSAVTNAQTALTYLPEFNYQNYWRLLDQTQYGYNAKFEFPINKFSTYKRRTHFTPIWMPNGSYTPYTWLFDCWTPDGMLSMNLTDSVYIQGSLWDDWHIAPVMP